MLRRFNRIGMEPPFKRRRVARIDFTDEELRHRRARNDLRLKSAFECIFEKYSKDFTGIADEIDLATGKIVVNRGHLSSLDDEKDPGREEDLFDELDGQIWSVDTGAMTEKGSGRRKSMIATSENSLGSGLDNEMRDTSQFPHLPECLTADAETGILSTDTDELARLHKNKRLSNLRANSSIYPAQAVQNDDGIEPIWRAPPLPDQISTCKENLQTQDVLLSDPCENRSISPPGKSLWLLPKRGRKPQLARRRETFTPQSKLSKLPFSPIKQTHIRRSMTSLSYEWSEISINSALERRSIDLPITSSQTSRSVCKIVSKVPWSKYEDHKLYYLRSEAGVADSQLAAAFPDRSETEIEERWLCLRLDDKNPLVPSAGYQKDSHTCSINTSDFAHRSNASSTTHCRSPISPRLMEIQPLRLHDPAIQQISPDKPQVVEQISSTDPKGHDDSDKVPEAGTTIDLAIDLTLSNEEEATKSADSGGPTENPEHTSKEGESAVNRTQGILKRVTRKSATFNKASERPSIDAKGAVGTHQRDALWYIEIPDMQNQTSPNSVSQPVPSSKKWHRKRRFSTRAKRQKQLARNRGGPEGHSQKPSTPSNFFTASSDIGTEVSPSSPVATRSSRSSQIVGAKNRNSDSYSSQQNEGMPNQCPKSISSITNSAITKIQCTDSDSTDRQETISFDDGKSMSYQLCMKCSSKVTDNRKGILRKKRLCSICSSRISYRPSSLDRPTSTSETDCRKDISNDSSTQAELRDREDSEDMDCLLEAQPVRIITPAKVRPQKASSAPSSTLAHAKVIKSRSIPLRPRVIDDFSDDELAMPVQEILNSTLAKVISSANISRNKSVRV